MEQLLTKLADFGAIGIIAAVAIWQLCALTRRAFDVIENNSKVMTQLGDLIKSHVWGKDDNS